MTAFSETYDTATPAGADDPSAADDRMRETKAAIQERLEVDHKFSLTGTEVSASDSGEHTKITFNVTLDDPSQVGGKSHLYMKDDELFYQDDTNTTLQLTDGGKILGDGLKDDSVDQDAIQLDNNAPLRARNAADDGDVQVIGLNSSDAVFIRSNTGAPAFLSGGAVPDPASDADIAHKKYVDQGADNMHDSEGGYNNVDVDGTKAKVYTVYFTGTLDGDESTNVAHGITGIDKILSVSVMLFNDASNKYYGGEAHLGASPNNDFLYQVDGTNVVISGVGTNFQGNKYRVKLDYIL